MKFWKLGLAISFVAVLGLTACDDSTSGDDNGKKEYKAGTIGCTPISQPNPYVQEMRMDSLTITTTFENKNGTVTETYEFNQDIPADTCDYYEGKIGKDPTDYATVKCEKRKITAVLNGKVDEKDFESGSEALAAACKALDGDDIPDVSKNDIDLSKVEACGAKNKGNEFVVKGTGVTLVCDGEIWKPAAVACTKEGEKKEFGTVELVCKDKKWTFETEEDCTKALKKAETFLDLVKFEASCVDGAWQLDLYNAEEPAEEEPAAEGEGEGEGED